MVPLSELEKSVSGSRLKPAIFKFKKEFWFGFILLLVIITLTVVPVFLVVLGGLNVNGWKDGASFSFDAWKKVWFESEKTLKSIGYSLLLSVRAPIAVIVGFVLAWLIARVKIPGHSFIEFSLWLAFFLPTLPLTLGWILLADPNNGLLNQWLHALPFIPDTFQLFNIYSLSGILWIHLTLSTVPIMVILLTPALRQFDSSYEEAALMNGANPYRTMGRITLPILMPAILTALLTGFIRSMEAFEIEQLLGTPINIQVYSTRIYDLLRWDPPQMPEAMALGTMVLIFLFILATVYQSLLRNQGYATITGKAVNFRPMVRTKWSYVASAICFLFIFIGVILPLALTFIGSFMKIFGFFQIDSPWTTSHWQKAFKDSTILRSVSNSIMVGLSVGLIGTVLYSLLAYTVIRTRLFGRNAISLLAWLPWTIPGILLSMGFLTLFLETPGLKLLYGSSFVLVVALIVKEMPLGMQMMRTSFQQISLDLEQAAYMSGANWFRTFYKVMLPIVMPMFVSVFVIAFMSTLRDISTTLLLANPSIRTLPLLMMEFSMSGAREVASVIGVFISVIALVVAMLARRIGIKLN